MMAAPEEVVWGSPGLVAGQVQKSPIWVLWDQLVGSELEFLQLQGHEIDSEVAFGVHLPLPEASSSFLHTPHVQLLVKRPFH